MIFSLALALVAIVGTCTPEDAFFQWDAKSASSAALAQRMKGQVGKGLDFRVIHTERSYNYKLRATWMTPETMRAVARLQQLTQVLPVEETCRRVAEAEAAGDTVILVEIDPREGSGVIPSTWFALLAPDSATGAPARTVRGVNTPALRSIPVLMGAAKRDYAYDLFWVVFPLRTPEGEPLFKPADREAELSVHIYDKVGKVRWPIPESIRQKLSSVP